MLILGTVKLTNSLKIADAESTLKARYNVAIPFPRPRPPKTALYKLGYEKPQNINVTGSYPFRLNTRLDETPTVDLVLTMPKVKSTQCLQKI